MNRLIIFDFDGVIVETEDCFLEAWRRVYDHYEARFPEERYLDAIGLSEMPFNPYEEVKSQSPKNTDSIAAIKELHESHYFALADQKPLMPGVLDLINSAARLDILIGIASSALMHWISRHLERLGLMDAFHQIKCFDDISHGKPDPEVYRSLLASTNVGENEAVAIEDSENGLAAAKNAGIPCIVVPSETTSKMEFSKADRVVSSLCEVTLEYLIGFKVARE